MNKRNVYAPCPYECNNKSSSGWCATTVCINPEYNNGTITINNSYLSKENNWTLVIEKLPVEDGWYLVYAPDYRGGSSSGLKNINGVMFSKFQKNKWSIEVGYHERPNCVKAWMKIPEPPYYYEHGASSEFL